MNKDDAIYYGFILVVIAWAVTQIICYLGKEGAFV